MEEHSNDQIPGF